MKRNGFEISRALWAYRNGDGRFEVFAGGTRLQAATQAKVRVAVIEYIGYSYVEISRLADIDNENDEYHTEVPTIDVWKEYARLRDEEKWDQKEIAKAKTGGNEKKVSFRLKWHTALSDGIKDKVSADILTERHLEEISSVLSARKLSDKRSNWFLDSQIWEELSNWVISNKRTTRETKKECDRWKEFIAEAERQYKEFAAQDTTLYEFPEEDTEGEEPTPYLFGAEGKFVKWLAEDKCRSLTAVTQVA